MESKIKTRNVKLEWNVLIHDFNSDKIKSYNIFNMYTPQEIKDRIKRNKITTYIEFKESLRTMFMAQFWSRTEYELLVSGLHTKVEPEKIDVWRQIEINLDRILEYIMREMCIEF